MRVEHQFLNEQFFQPNWKVDYLFIGTFNPIGGEKVNYFYGRKTNFTWPILSNIFDEILNPFEIETSLDFFKNLKIHKIACVDMIKYVDFDENKYDQSRVTGKGYKDSNIINSKVCRVYNTDAILQIIKSNPKIKVFSTWGKGSNLNEWRIEVQKIPNLINLVSPSRAARVPVGESKYYYILKDWKNKILNK